MPITELSIKSVFDCLATKQNGHRSLYALYLIFSATEGTE